MDDHVPTGTLIIISNRKPGQTPLYDWSSHTGRSYAHECLEQIHAEIRHMFYRDQLRFTELLDLQRYLPFRFTEGREENYPHSIPPAVHEDLLFAIEQLGMARLMLLTCRTRDDNWAIGHYFTDRPFIIPVPLVHWGSQLRPETMLGLTRPDAP